MSHDSGSGGRRPPLPEAAHTRIVYKGMQRVRNTDYPRHTSSFIGRKQGRINKRAGPIKALRGSTPVPTQVIEISKRSKCQKGLTKTKLSSQKPN